ncbi:S-adenosylmethionine:tRNA ribosyltransferase-isomerase [Bacteroidia bacterium]|nr:S-adenosylmethionine:tRNA ribosyltransferase-isomerase [Bacteroidia bacterium]
MIIKMKLSKFKFELPQELIASYPTEHRDESRLMVLHRKTGKIEHKIFKDILGYFDEQDTLVFNDSKVFPARLYGNKERTNAQIEVFLLRELSQTPRLWDVLVDPARKIRIGNKLYFGEGETMVSEVIDNTTSRGRTLRFLFDGTHEEFKKALYDLGEMPLPEYMNRPAEPSDIERYQTIFAKNEGAVIAPAAGMHFSRELMKRLEIKGCELAFITVHSGLGNFRKIDVEDLSKHKMDSEEFFIGTDAEKIVNASKDARKQICAIGGSVLRALETATTSLGYLKALDAWTNKFIFPTYDFVLVTSTVSNFHMPYSVMMMQAAAFAGYDLLMEAYTLAIKEKYRFGVYGDAMLIL